jgi:hypothetical protein
MRSMASMAWMTLLVGSLAWATEPPTGQRPATAKEGAAPGTEEGVIDPKADAALRRMSDYLSGLKSLKVDTITVDEKFTANGHKIQELQDSRLSVQRPGELRVDRVSPAGHVSFRYDGKRFSIYNKEKNVYAIAPAPDRLDAAIDEARGRLHVDAPGGDLLVSDPYRALTEGVIEGRYIGLEPIEGVMAHHIGVIKKDTDWQIWIKDGPEAVPLRYVVTSRDLPGHPEFTLQLKNWQPNAPVSPDSFAFSPPPGAKRVDFAPPARKAGTQGE